MKLRSYSNNQPCICTTPLPEKKWQNPHLQEEVIEFTKDCWVKTSDGDLFKIHAVYLAEISDMINEQLLGERSHHYHRTSPSDIFITTPTFKSIMDVVYEGSCAIDQHNLENLLATGTQYNIKCVLNLCGQFMLGSIRLDNSISYYKKATVHLCEHVTDKILHYVRVNFSDLIGHQSAKVKLNYCLSNCRK